MPTTDRIDDGDRASGVQRLISLLLRGGVLLSVALLVTGTLLAFVGPGHPRTSNTSFHRLVDPSRSFPHSLGDIVSGVMAGHGTSIILLGLLVLVATPILRVGVSVFVFAFERDRVFVAITLAVLGVLMISVLLGKAGG